MVSRSKFSVQKIKFGRIIFRQRAVFILFDFELFRSESSVLYAYQPPRITFCFSRLELFEVSIYMSPA
jgi:hypothetical protein